MILKSFRGSCRRRQMTLTAEPVAPIDLNLSVTVFVPAYSMNPSIHVTFISWQTAEKHSRRSPKIAGTCHREFGVMCTWRLMCGLVKYGCGCWGFLSSSSCYWFSIRWSVTAEPARSLTTNHTHLLNPRPDLMETSDFRYTNTENTRQTFSHHPLFLHVNQSFKMTQNYTAKVFTLSNKHWESNQSFHFCYQTAFVSVIVQSVTSATRGRSIKTKERTFAVCCVVGRTYRGYVAAVQLLRAG